MTDTPEWAVALRALERIGTGEFVVGDILGLWLAGENTTDDVAVELEGAMLAASQIGVGDERRCLLSIPMRVNTLAEALGETYWTALAKAPPKVVVSKSGTAWIAGTRYQVQVVDVGAWRAWWAKNRGPEALASDQLRAFVERIERLEEEKRNIADDIRGVYSEAKAIGYDSKILRQVIMIRRKDQSAFEEEQTLLELYMQALEMGFGRADD